MANEGLVISTLVEMADNLVEEFDVIDLVTLLSHRCAEALDVDAAGVMLASPEGELQYLASSSESMRLLEVFQIQTDEGPCIDCFNSGEPIVNHALSVNDGRWPRFTPVALEAGFASVHCLPLRLRGRTIGALNFLRTREGWLDSYEVTLAQSMADLATITLIQHRAAADAKVLNLQLSYALNSRIIIEQAKGMVAQATNCGLREAFALIRSYARSHHLGLTALATSLVEGTFLLSDLGRPQPEGAGNAHRSATPNSQRYREFRE